MSSSHLEGETTVFTTLVAPIETQSTERTNAVHHAHLTGARFYEKSPPHHSTWTETIQVDDLKRPIPSTQTLTRMRLLFEDDR